MAILADKSELLSLKEASVLSPYNAEYLNSLARKGKIKATKLGRDWFITKHDLFHYVKKQYSESKLRLSHLQKYVETLNVHKK